MGQQQLLLIVLGVIIVGVAVVVGINLFNANAEQSTKDTVVSEATNIGALAQQFFKKPTAMGGGGNKFVGFNAIVPTLLKTTTTATYVITDGDQSCTIKGTPVETSYIWSVTTTVTPTGMTSAFGATR